MAATSTADQTRDALIEAIKVVAPGQADYYISVMDAGKERGFTAIQALFDMGLEDVVQAAVWAHLGIEVQQAQPEEIDLDKFAVWGHELARSKRAIPLTGNRLLAEDPGDTELQRLVKPILGNDVRLVAISDPSALDDLIVWAEQHLTARELAEAAIQETGVSSAPTVSLDDASSDSEVARLVDEVLRRAVEQRASDVHIEPQANVLAVRYRVDGVLRGESYPIRLAPAVVSRLKVMARIDIAQSRRPADGRFSFSSGGTKVDCRVVTLPSVWGESATIRLLGLNATLTKLDNLGFSPPVLKAIRTAIASPAGALFVTGPTGSGKTTTLYSVLGILATPERKVLTIEDPVEQRLENIAQHQVDPAVGFTFATALRSFLRADPDIIMVGEVRDIETAEMAIAAAYTGHFVISSFHASSAALAPLRLMEMGIPAALVASGLYAVVAQRLVRKLCQECKIPDDINYGFEWPCEKPERIWKANEKGCRRCAVGGKGGYIGRQAVAEVLIINEPVRSAIIKGASPGEVRKFMWSQGTGSMWADGLVKVAAGETSVAELMRVVSQEDDEIETSANSSRPKGEGDKQQLVMAENGVAAA